MTKIKFVEVEQIDKTIETFAIIEYDNGMFQSMLKSTYDAMQAVQIEPALPPAPPAENQAVEIEQPLE